MSTGALFCSEYVRGCAWLEKRSQQIIDDTVSICEIPAPPFAEQARAAYVAKLMAGAGEVSIDECGNVICISRYPQPGQMTLLISAHLDTVFPLETDVTVRRSEGCLYAPGISDNSASVAIAINLARLICDLKSQLNCGLAFVANVGEEGLGDLRGMKHLFGAGLAAKWPVGAALIFDGALGSIATCGVASRRLEVVFNGAGGHSWGDFGEASAIHALGRAIAAIDAITVPVKPRTTYNIGVVDGGVSVNAIAEEARMLVDMRSEDAEVLNQLEAKVQEAIIAAVSSHTQLRVSITVVGDRPGGQLPSNHPLLEAVLGVYRSSHIDVSLLSSSTDANVPLSLGVPAMAVGLIVGGRTHTHQEYLQENSILLGARHGLALILAAEQYISSLRG